MFTGIVDACGTVERVHKSGKMLKLSLRVPPAYRRLRPGASVSVDGVCLTVTAAKAGKLNFDVIPETLRRSRLGLLIAGERVNLERPLRWQGRVDGHLVQGHVQATATVIKAVARGKARDFLVAPPPRLRRRLAEKGSVALNGVSLTVGHMSPKAFWVHVIPHTLKKTNLKAWQPGTKVNLETDVMLK